MLTKTKLTLFLLIAPWILAEVISSNTPITKFFNPIEFIFYTIGYWLPIILIWNFKNKYKVNYLWIFLLWIAYAIFNEWLIAKTLLENSSVSYKWFWNFWILWWVNFSWSLVILPWHAFFSVMFPIIFAEYKYNSEKETIIFWKKTNIFIFIFCLFILIIMWKDWQWNLSPGQYILFYAWILLTIFITKIKLNTKENTKETKKPYLIWYLSTFHYMLLFTIALKVKFIIFLAIAFITLFFILRYFLKINDYQKARFWVWSYLWFWTFTSLATITNNRFDVLIMTIIIITFLHIFIINKKI